MLVKAHLPKLTILSLSIRILYLAAYGIEDRGAQNLAKLPLTNLNLST